MSKKAHHPTLSDEQLVAAVADIARSNGPNIGRSFLQKIDNGEVRIKRILPNNEQCICQIRGMSYCICLNENKPSIRIFDPAYTARGDGCRAIGHGGAGRTTENR